MSTPVITVENLSKAYRIGLKEEIPDTLISAMSGLMKAPFRKLQDLRKLDTFGHAGGEEEDLYWALKDVSFEVKEGEVLGVIGRNGAGKSTLLKILSRITEPTSGRAVIRGRVSSLLEVGTGFHPELSGRENVYLNGTILGMTKSEIDRKFDEIVDFSGVEKFLDTPIKRYSSGMKVRLAFAVAAHLEPEILIIDEVLAVGDAEFQKKCMGKMQDVAKGGRTVLFVSHNMAAVEALCSHGLLLAQGQVAWLGSTESAVSRYFGPQHSPEKSELGDISLKQHINRRERSEPILTRLTIKDRSGNVQTSWPCSSAVRFEVEYSSSSIRRGLCCALFICQRGTRIAMFHTHTHSRLDLSSTFQGKLECNVDSIPLVPGQYNLDVAIGDGVDVLDYIENVATVSVLPSDALGTGMLPSAAQSLLVISAKWSLSQPSLRVGGVDIRADSR